MLEQFFSACGAGMCVALIMLLLKEFYHSLAARFFAILILGAFVYLCHNWLPERYYAYAYMIESATPAFFWISCRLTFQEGSSLPRLGLFIAIYSFTLPVIKHVIIQYLGMTTDLLEFLGRELTQYCEYILVIMGIFALFVGQEDDLVESRRHLRWAIMGASGLSLGWAIFSFNLQLGSELSRILAIDLSILIVIWTIFNGRQDIWGKPEFDSKIEHRIGNRVSKIETLGNAGEQCADNDFADGSYHPNSSKEVDGELLPEKIEIDENASLMKLREMMHDGFYRQENLTLKDLASAMNTPEYKVRAVINKELGYRNFNEFINEYRIKEAAQRLLSEPETPISNIALDVGYRTLSSFNRAFRKQKDTTPTAFREE